MIYKDIFIFANDLLKRYERYWCMIYSLCVFLVRSPVFWLLGCGARAWRDGCGQGCPTAVTQGLHAIIEAFIFLASSHVHSPCSRAN